MHIKKTLLLIGKSSPCDGSGFLLSLFEWPFTICLMPYNRKENVLSASLNNKKIPSFYKHYQSKTFTQIFDYNCRWLINQCAFAVSLNKTSFKLSSLSRNVFITEGKTWFDKLTEQLVLVFRVIHLSCVLYIKRHVTATRTQSFVRVKCFASRYII